MLRRALGRAGDARRVELWFDHFHRAGPKQGAPPAAAGKSPTLGGPGPCPSEEERAGGAQGLEGHKFGARALARFVFRQREEHWGLLCWRGRHAHSPVSVVARPHYLADLDVARTVEALLREAPDFWDSPELRAELRDGSFLAIDLPFFVGRLERALHEERVEQGKGAGVRSSSAHGMSAVSLVREFLRASNFSESLRWVLPVASDKGLLGAANAVAGALSRRSPHRSSSSSRGSGAAWEGEQGLDARPAQVRRLWESTVSVLELGQGMPWPSLDALLLCCACVPGARQVLRLLRDPEWGHLRAQAQESTQGLRLLLLGSARPSPSSPAAPLPTPTERGGGGSRVARMSTEAAACVCLASFATRLALLPPAFGEDGERRGRVDEATGAWYSSLDRLLAREGIEARREGGGAAAGDSYKLVSDGEEADRPERGAGKRKRRDREGKGSRARRQRRRSEEPEARGVARGGRGSSHSPPPSQSTAAETPSWWRLALDGFEATWEAVRPLRGHMRARGEGTVVQRMPLPRPCLAPPCVLLKP